MPHQLNFWKSSIAVKREPAAGGIYEKDFNEKFTAGGK
jgi:hypothetical protein